MHPSLKVASSLPVQHILHMHTVVLTSQATQYKVDSVRVMHQLYSLLRSMQMLYPGIQHNSSDYGTHFYRVVTVIDDKSFVMKCMMLTLTKLDFIRLMKIILIQELDTKLIYYTSNILQLAVALLQHA